MTFAISMTHKFDKELTDLDKAHLNLGAIELDFITLVCEKDGITKVFDLPFNAGSMTHLILMNSLGIGCHISKTRITVTCITLRSLKTQGLSILMIKYMIISQINTDVPVTTSQIVLSIMKTPMKRYRSRISSPANMLFYTYFMNIELGIIV